MAGFRCEPNPMELGDKCLVASISISAKLFVSVGVPRVPRPSAQGYVIATEVADKLSQPTVWRHNEAIIFSLVSCKVAQLLLFESLNLIPCPHCNSRSRCHWRFCCLRSTENDSKHARQRDNTSDSTFSLARPRESEISDIRPAKVYQCD